MSKKLTAALTKLDPENDEHWTAEGLPLVSVVQEFASDDSVTRQTITAIAPSYTREAWRKQRAELADDQAKAPEPDPVVAAPVVDKTEESPATTNTGEEDFQDTNARLAAEYDGVARACMEDVRELEQLIEDSKIQIQQKLGEHDQAVRRREQIKPSPTEAEARREYIDRQNQIRAERVARRNSALEGLSPGDLRKGSPLDEAHARRNSRGNKRPNRQPLAGTA